MNIWNRIKAYFSSLFPPAETWDQHVWTDEGLSTLICARLERELQGNPPLIRDAKGWAYPAPSIRERYESECG